MLKKSVFIFIILIKTVSAEGETNGLAGITLILSIAIVVGLLISKVKKGSSSKNKESEAAVNEAEEGVEAIEKDIKKEVKVLDELIDATKKHERALDRLTVFDKKIGLATIELEKATPGSSTYNARKVELEKLIKSKHVELKNVEIYGKKIYELQEKNAPQFNDIQKQFQNLGPVLGLRQIFNDKTVEDVKKLEFKAEEVEQLDSKLKKHFVIQENGMLKINDVQALVDKTMTHIQNSAKNLRDLGYVSEDHGKALTYSDQVRNNDSAFKEIYKQNNRPLEEIRQATEQSLRIENDVINLNKDIFRGAEAQKTGLTHLRKDLPRMTQFKKQWEL